MSLPTTRPVNRSDRNADAHRIHAAPGFTTVPRCLAAASLSAEAIRLEDSLSGQLEGYGSVHASIPEKLDPVIEAMAQTLNRLAMSLQRYGRTMRSQ